MAKKLTAKSIRQGQTVYIVIRGCIESPKMVVTAGFLRSNNEAKSAVSLVSCKVSMISKGGHITYSRRKATSKAKELNRMMGMM